MLILFAGTGCSGLIYEIVWFQLLQLVIGSTAISLAVVLTAFMGGLAIGSIVLPRWRFSPTNPLRTYAIVELGVALFGVLALAGIPTYRAPRRGRAIARRYVHARPDRGHLLAAADRSDGSVVAADRAVDQVHAERNSSWAILYGVNTGGAVVGCLLAGFYLLRIHDVAFATYVAAGSTSGSRRLVSD